MLGFLSLAILLVCVLGMSGQSQQTSPPPPKQEVPDAPSAARPQNQLPSAPQPQMPVPPNPEPQTAPPPPEKNQQPPQSEAPVEEPQPRPPLDIKTVPEGQATKEQPSAQEQIYTLQKNVNQVIVPVMVKDEDGHLVSGLVPKDFSLYEDGVQQKMNFFTSDPFALSAAVIFDLGMPDVAYQKVNKTFPALQGAFSPYDEVALYTYSTTYSRVSDFAAVGQILASRLDALKTVSAANNSPPVTGGPLGPQGPVINGRQIDPGAPIVYTPPKTAHVLNDTILAAAVDLSRRDPTRRKIIFIISDGREYGSRAGYRDVLRVLLSNGIMVYGIGVEGAAIPGYSKLAKLHIPKMGYTDILPKYANATGGEILTEFSQTSIDAAYARSIGDARNQYTLGYLAKAMPSSAYREIEVRVNRPGCKGSNLRPCINVYAKDGYYPLPPRR